METPMHLWRVSLSEGREVTKNLTVIATNMRAAQHKAEEHCREDLGMPRAEAVQCVQVEANVLVAE